MQPPLAGSLFETIPSVVTSIGRENTGWHGCCSSCLSMMIASPTRDLLPAVQPALPARGVPTLPRWLPAARWAGRAAASLLSRVPGVVERQLPWRQTGPVLGSLGARALPPATDRATVLAIGAHPDDVEIGCGGTLASHVRHGDRVVILTLSAGERAGAPAVRSRESVASASRLGAELVLETLDDTRISEGPTTIAAIETVIARLDPSAVYVHTESDRHQDHRNVHRAAMVATRNVPSVFCYQSPSSTTHFSPTRFVPIAEQLSTKLQLLALYGSQSSTKAYLAPAVIEATAVYWSRFARASHVEPFEVVREQAEIK